MKREYPAIDMVRTGQNIKRIMLSRGITVKDIQLFLELGAPQGIYHWIEGKSMPTLDNLYALSELFRIPLDMILKGNRRFVYMPFQDARCRRLYAYCARLEQMTAI